MNRSVRARGSQVCWATHLGVGVDLKTSDARVEGRDLGHVVVLALTLLLLELEGDAADGAALNALHQVRRVAGNLTKRSEKNPVSNQKLTHVAAAAAAHGGAASSRAYLVAEALRGDDGNLIADALVGLKVERQAGVVPLDDDLGGLLDGLGANATHFGGIGAGGCRWAMGFDESRS